MGSFTINNTPIEDLAEVVDVNSYKFRLASQNKDVQTAISMFTNPSAIYSSDFFSKINYNKIIGAYTQSVKDYIYYRPLTINNVKINEKLLVNGTPTRPIATKGYRPLGILRKSYTIYSYTENININIVMSNGVLKCGDTIINSKSFILTVMGAGGKGGNNKHAVIGTGWSGAGGGQGGWYKCCIIVKDGFEGTLLNIQNDGSIIRLRYRGRDDCYLDIYHGGNGGDGVSGSGGAGGGGTVTRSDNWDAETKGCIAEITYHYGVSGRPTKPGGGTYNTNGWDASSQTYNAEHVAYDKEVGVAGVSGNPGNQYTDRGGPGAGGYYGGRGGGVSEGGTVLNETSNDSGAGGGGASAWGNNFYSGVYGSAGGVSIYY